MDSSLGGGLILLGYALRANANLRFYPLAVIDYLLD
jgi:hypothetical protein